ncbi:MAG: DUF5615 family PIN-like protein [Anaerolineae bacterium]|nr:DUF5615 family PIN-like protein [Anaerolineae bacterium]
MKFLVDAQLPRRLSRQLNASGHDSIHTLDLPLKNFTTDSAIITIADNEDRVIITKDADFVNSYWFSYSPKRLLLIATGNISNLDLESLLFANLPMISDILSTKPAFCEITRETIIAH